MNNAHSNKGPRDVGARVRIRIADFSLYAFGAAESLSGQVGVIEEMHRSGNLGLVRFDTPARPWSTNQLPVAAFWFEWDELEDA